MMVLDSCRVHMINYNAIETNGKCPLCILKNDKQPADFPAEGRGAKKPIKDEIVFEGGVLKVTCYKCEEPLIRINFRKDSHYECYPCQLNRLRLYAKKYKKGYDRK